MKWLKRALIVLLALPLLGFVWQLVAERHHYAPPGKLVEVDGHKLHLHCEGAGSPTVILEASGLSSSLEWDDLLPRIARRTRVCAYDRAGMGWSDPAPAPHDFVADLHAALAGEKPPYVLVGHSAGGVVVRVYQRRHPAEVSGLILVDTASQYLLERWPQIAPRMIDNFSRARWLSAIGLIRLANPLHLDGIHAAFTYRTRTFTAARELVMAMKEEFPRLPPPGDVPTVVLTHAHGGDWSGPGVIDDEAAVERDWQEGQKQLAQKATLLRADHAGHFIPTEEPELLLRAIDLILGAPPAPPR